MPSNFLPTDPARNRLENLKPVFISHSKDLLYSDHSCGPTVLVPMRLQRKDKSTKRIMEFQLLSSSSSETHVEEIQGNFMTYRDRSITSKTKGEKAASI